MALYNEKMQAYQALIEQALPEYLPATDTPWATTARAMAYACEGGGKRLRPVLMMVFADLCGGDAKSVLPFACALEMIHSSSLVHDDLPCMDNSPLRRGKPSVHAAFGEDMALLAGDALLNRAFEVMLDPDTAPELPVASRQRAGFAIAQAAGIDGMMGGQTMDLECEHKRIDVETLETLQRGKTAALLRAACSAGAMLAGADEARVKAAAAYGEALGLCFQIVDDLLDATATAEQLGKPVGSDADHDKATYVTLLGLTEAREMAKKRAQEAGDALDAFGAAADDLRRLTEELLSRTY